MNITTERYADYDCVKLDNGKVALWVTQNVGPRIIGLQLPGGSNLMAVIPGVNATTPSGNIYQFRGGHRLWHAPEDAERTYLPDDAAVVVEAIAGGIRTTQLIESATGIEKQMAITLPSDAAHVVIDHTLTNRGLWPVELAPWAITQLKPGGFAILPQSAADTGLLPNRRLAFWPYATISSPHLKLGDRYIFVHAAMTGGKFKLGWANPAGWLAYAVDSTLFVKQAAYQDDGEYYDFGSSSECYCDPRIIELETLGPRTSLAPGASVTHREEWRLFAGIPLTAEEGEVAELFSRLNIG